MDTTKLGIATAKAMDDIERFVASGHIADDGYVGAVCIVVAIDSKTRDDIPDRDNLRDVTTQFFVFSEPREVYIQDGLLGRALHNYASGSLDDDE